MKRKSTEASDIEGGLNSGKASRPRANFKKYLPQNVAAAFWRRVLGLLYSFSLVILMLLTFAFVVVTPVDVLIQTWGTLAVGVKLFIVLAANSFFVMASIIYYFLRLFRSRVLVNSIPAKSVYLPLEKHDLPSKSLAYIHKNLRRCVGDIKVRAGPLENELEPFDYPGMAPPLYIQQRNMRLGFQKTVSELPENCVFEEVINSIGLKMKADGLFAGNFQIPKHYTFREVILAMAEEMDDEGVLDADLVAVVRGVVEDYERFKFGPGLVPHAALLKFLIQLEILMTRYINSTSAEFSRDSMAQLPLTRSATYNHTSSVGSRVDVSDVDTNTLDMGIRLASSPSRASFLDPFEYRDDASSLRLRPVFGLLSRSSSRSRDLSRRSTDLKPATDSSGRRRNSLWSMLKSRFSNTGASSRRSSLRNPFSGGASANDEG